MKTEFAFATILPGSWKLPKNSVWNIPEQETEFRHDNPIALVVDSSGRVYGTRKLSAARIDATHTLRGYVTIYGKKARVYLSDQLFEREDGTLAKLPVLRLCHGHPLNLNRINSIRSALKHDGFFRSYVETALWESSENEDTLDSKYTLADVDMESLDRLLRTCAAFWESAATVLDSAYDTLGYTPERAAMDLRFAHVGAGAGFRDGHLPDEVAKQLRELAGYTLRHEAYTSKGKVYFT